MESPLVTSGNGISLVGDAVLSIIQKCVFDSHRCQHAVSLSTAFYPHCFNRLCRILSTMWEHSCEECLFRAVSSPEIVTLKHFLILQLLSHF